MNPPTVKNPLPSLGSLKELYASGSSNLIMQLAFNPQVAAYAAGGDRPVFAEAGICTLITTLITIPSIAKALDRARYNSELAGDIPENRLLQRLPRNRWLFALLVGILLAPVAGMLFNFIFHFYGFTSWTFYQLFWVKLAYLAVLGKILVKLSILRFTQPDIGRDR